MKRLFLISAVILTIMACSEKLEPESIVLATKTAKAVAANTSVQENDGEFVLGDKLENPYSVQNMEKALKELQKTNSTFKNMKIEVSHYYVRIEATTDDAFQNLQFVNDIDLYRTPMDYAIVKSGSRYKEKDYTGKYQVYWAAVPIEYEFAKDLKVKILEKLFLPKGNGNPNFIVKKAEVADQSLLDALENQALTMFDLSYSK